MRKKHARAQISLWEQEVLLCLKITSILYRRMDKTLQEVFLLSNSTLKEYEIVSDHFEGVYSNPLVNAFCLILYLVGLMACFGLALVVWFEKSGQAGPYRTLGSIHKPLGQKIGVE